MAFRYLAAVLLVLFLPRAAQAQESPFAALEVVAKGPQSFDISTGITTLASGGRISDHESGVVLTGGFMRFREGDFVEVKEARVEGSFGVIEAPRVRLDIAAATLAASEGVHFTGADLNLRAATLTVYLDPEVGVATGGVTGNTPPLEARAAVVDLSGSTALLLAPYRYQDGPLTLESQRAGDLLSLQWSDDTEGEKAAFRVSTEPAPGHLARLEPYMP